jgi:hypothetical protein
VPAQDDAARGKSGFENAEQIATDDGQFVIGNCSEYLGVLGKFQYFQKSPRKYK